MTTWTISGILGFVAGGAFIWFTKTTIQSIVIGGNALAAKLRMDATIIEAKASAIKKVL